MFVLFCVFLVLALLAVVIPFAELKIRALVGGGLLVLSTLFLGISMSTIVPVGHQSVTTVFGEVRAELPNGFHLINPLSTVHVYDIRDKQTTLEDVGCATQDQLVTQLDITVQFHVNESMCKSILENVGDANALVETHLTPSVRNSLREQVKSIKNTEELFRDQTLEALQANILAQTQEYCAPRGMTITAIQLRDVRLPEVLRVAIESKKTRETDVAKQQAELERMKIEQQQQVTLAQAGLDSAKIEAESERVRADAKAYAITAINKAIEGNPAYIQLEAIKGLVEMGKSGNTIIFADPNGINPLPLMNVGKPVSSGKK